MTTAAAESRGEGLVEIDGHSFYAIPDVDRIAPFLMSMISDGDRWAFVSSAGALTAGRRDSSHPLFPYETDDRLHRSAGITGPVTALHVHTRDGDVVWRPFHPDGDSRAHRTLLKSVVGDSVIFEERHPTLGLTFAYRWRSCERFGFVRTSTLGNVGERPVTVRVVDGIVNVQPAGIEPGVMQRMSNLTNAYRRSEVVDRRTRLVVYSLESAIIDRPEPTEVLRATAVWSTGPGGSAVSVATSALTDLVSGAEPIAIARSTGIPGAYLLSASVDLDSGASQSWDVVADVALDQSAVADLRRYLSDHEPTVVADELAGALDRSTRSLVEMMAPADALQRTRDRAATAHHFANVTYNVMRGGVPLDGYRISSADFVRSLGRRNRTVANRHAPIFEGMAELIDREELIAAAESSDDPDLIRLAHEYLPFGFSRRHGDPSRPWNAFSINVRNVDGDPILYYEGNWRDIFQNWEALCHSFPRYLPAVIAVFVGASTPDGFNPYRLTSEGFEWEVPDADDPWSNIGYWGDHQLVYLLRLLEAADRFLPGTVEGMLVERRFTYADVPYRLAPYREVVANPKATIRFDADADRRAHRRAEAIGSDGKLLHTDGGDVYLATLAEKLLVPALSKLSNLVPGGGIWMNTQRPEWNDANNALVGYGVSMVTLFHLRSYLVHLARVFRSSGRATVTVSAEVARWLAGVCDALGVDAVECHDDKARKGLMDQLGACFEQYRSAVYQSGFSESLDLDLATVDLLGERGLSHIDAAIAANRRSDGLFHSYNLIRYSPGRTAVGIEHLPEMLEGQVAAIESGVLSPAERADVVDALFSSEMYREDQHSFMLYPPRTPPGFLDKNVVPRDSVTAIPLLDRMLAAGDGSIVTTDVDGHVRFVADHVDRAHLDAALERALGDARWRDLVIANHHEVVALYEHVFGHHSYTGRSGSMYGYEGIGSIYWHMVAKLLVAIQRSVVDAVDSGAARVDIDRLIAHYRAVRSGLGFNKTADAFGAMPLDPYSHTPMHAGAQQPGMTGLVKEEVLTRPLELGVRVAKGCIHFDPALLSRRELLDQAEGWEVLDVGKRRREIVLGIGTLGMTVCQVPVVVAVDATGRPSCTVTMSDGTVHVASGLVLDATVSSEIFARSGRVERVDVRLPGAMADSH